MAPLPEVPLKVTGCGPAVCRLGSRTCRMPAGQQVVCTSDCVLRYGYQWFRKRAVNDLPPWICNGAHSRRCPPSFSCALSPFICCTHTPHSVTPQQVCRWLLRNFYHSCSMSSLIEKWASMSHYKILPTNTCPLIAVVKWSHVVKLPWEPPPYKHTPCSTTIHHSLLAGDLPVYNLLSDPIVRSSHISLSLSLTLQIDLNNPIPLHLSFSPPVSLSLSYLVAGVSLPRLSW